MSTPVLSVSGIDLSSLLNELGLLEAQLVNASKQISQQREAQKAHVASGGNGSAPLVRPVILPCEGFRVEDGSENTSCPPTHLAQLRW